MLLSLYNTFSSDSRCLIVWVWLATVLATCYCSLFVHELSPGRGPWFNLKKVAEAWLVSSVVHQSFYELMSRESSGKAGNVLVFECI